MVIIDGFSFKASETLTHALFAIRAFHGNRASEHVADAFRVETVFIGPGGDRLPDQGRWIRRFSGLDGKSEAEDNERSKDSSFEHGLHDDFLALMSVLGILGSLWISIVRGHGSATWLWFGLCFTSWFFQSMTDQIQAFDGHQTPLGRRDGRPVAFNQ